MQCIKCTCTKCLPPPTELENYILEDLRSREDLAMAWIYQEFANAQNYNVTSSMMTSQLDDKHGGAGGGGGMNSYNILHKTTNRS